MACSEFDGQVVRLESELKEVMDQFVRVRLIQCNSLDLDLFQFDYDLTFAAFFLNADRTIYGRFGTRSSDKDASRDISIAGFRKAMEGALALHRDFPANREALQAKTGAPAKFKIAQDFPTLTGKYTPFLDYKGQVSQSCIHCHMLGEAARKDARNTHTMTDTTIYPWPMPNIVGLVFDPQEKATLKSVTPGSPAASGGFQTGDEILQLEGQPILSIADVQWVLHQATPPTTLQAIVRRNKREQPTTLSLSKGWRHESDISWRTTSWDLRRIATGGLLLKPLTPTQRRLAKLEENQMGLRVEHVGQYGAHAVAKKAGFKQNDIIISFDSLDSNVRETELFAHVLRNRPAGSLVPVTVLRDGLQKAFQLKIQ